MPARLSRLFHALTLGVSDLWRWTAKRSGFASLLFTCLALLLSPAALRADAVFIYEGPQFEHDAQIIVREGKVVLSDVEESTLSLIYDTNANIFRILNHPNKSYLELSGEFVETMMSGMDAMLPQLLAMAENADISDDQKKLIARISGQMRKNSDQADSPLRVESIASNRNILGLTCEEFAVSYQASAYDVCTVDYEKIGLPDRDKASLKELSALLKRMSGSVQFHEAQSLATVLGHMDGVILEAVDDEGESMLRLKQLRLASRSSSDGEIPTGYTETDLFSIFSGL